MLEFENCINYWAFNGSTAKDESIVAEGLESAADLSEAVSLDKAEEINRFPGNFFQVFCFVAFVDI